MSTFYLKYRPQTIAELDLQPVREQLTNLLASGKFPHAFLFSGPRGLGKTSAARILAKAINCETRFQVPATSFQEGQTQAKEQTQAHSQKAKSLPVACLPVGMGRHGYKLKDDIEPCNHCESCIAITKGTAVDVIEIDGASNRGIDDVRILREGVLSSPVQMKKKIYIIDEVHMLTKEAFNALLKTLEEPPEHVVFIFATTEAHKVPETILSRTFQLTFRRATADELKHALNRVVQGEQLTIEDAVLDLIIERADGGFRDSHKMLEQLALSNAPITLDLFHTLFPQAAVEELREALVQKDLHRALTWIQAQQQRGVDWEVVTRTILIQWKDQLILALKEKDQDQTVVLRSLIELGLRAGGQLRTSLIPTLPWELVAIDWCGGEKMTNDKLQMVSDKGTQEQENTKSTTRQHDYTTTTQKTQRTRKHKNTEIEKQSGENDLPNYSDSQEAKAEHERKPLETLPFDTLTKDWEAFIKKVQDQNHSVAALLRSAQPETSEGGIITIKVYYEFHKGRLETDKCQEIVETAIEQAFGFKQKIRYILGEKSEKIIKETQEDQSLAKFAEEIFT